MGRAKKSSKPEKKTKVEEFSGEDTGLSSLIEVLDYIPVSKRGRPKKEIAKTEFEKIEVMASKGLTVDQMSAILGISKRTFERRAKEEKLLSDAIARGRASATEIISGIAYRMAQYNYKMTQFWLKTQAGWKETKVIEHTGSPLDGLTDEEKSARAQKIAERLGLVDVK